MGTSADAAQVIGVNCHPRAGGGPDRDGVVYYVYIMASKRNGTLYIGTTGDLLKRVWQHKKNVVEGFTQRYQVHRLVYFDQTEDVKAAITREKQMKKWNRAWKLRLIEERNPEWRDLFDELSGGSREVGEEKTGFPPSRE